MKCQAIQEYFWASLEKKLNKKGKVFWFSDVGYFLFAIFLNTSSLTSPWILFHR